MYRNILLPTDGSPASDQALEAAADLAKLAVDATPPIITVLLAADPKEARAGASLPLPVRQEMERALKDADEFVLARAEDRLRARGVPVSTKRIEGGPAAVVAQEAARGGYDLIVMGSRGLDLKDEAADLVGSVTERVLRRVACAVLVVKESGPR